MSVHLQLDLDNSRHRHALQALLSAFGTDAGAPAGHVLPRKPEYAETPPEPPTSAPGAGGADTAEASPQHTVTPPAVSPPENSAPEASHAGPDEFPGTTDWAALDVKGTPYNDSIHTGTRSKNKDQTWRYARGTDRAQAEALEARLRSAAQGEATRVEPEQPAPGNPGFGQQQAAGATAQPPEQPGAVAPPQTEAPKVDFQLLMRRIHSEGVTQEQRDEALQAVGVHSLPQLSTMPEMVPSVYAQLFPNE